MARIILKTEVQIILEIPDELAPRMSKQDVCNTAGEILHLAGEGAEVFIGEVNRGTCSWRVEPNFGDIPADEADVVEADDEFAGVDV